MTLASEISIQLLTTNRVAVEDEVDGVVEVVPARTTVRTKPTSCDATTSSRATTTLSDSYQKNIKMRFGRLCGEIYPIASDSQAPNHTL